MSHIILYVWLIVRDGQLYFCYSQEDRDSLEQLPYGTMMVLKGKTATVEIYSLWQFSRRRCIDLAASYLSGNVTSIPIVKASPNDSRPIKHISKNSPSKRERQLRKRDCLPDRTII